MNWVEMEKNELVNAVSVLELVPLRAGVPSSDFIKVTSRKKSLEMSLSSTVTAVVRAKLLNGGFEEIGKEFFIDRGLLTAHVLHGKKWKGSFSIALDESKLYIKQGSRKAEFVMRSEPVGGYGTWHDTNGLKEIKLSEDLKKLVQASNSCATGDPSMPHLNCVYIGGGLVLSTNEKQLFLGQGSHDDSLRIPFPVGIIPLLGGDLVSAVAVDGDRVILECGCGFIEGMVSAMAKKDFPKRSVVETVNIAKKWPVMVVLPSEKLFKMLARLTNYLATVKREDWVVSVQLGKGIVKAFVDVQQGRFEESMKVEGLDMDIVMDWKLDAVTPVLEYISTISTEVKVRTSLKKKTPYLISCKDIALLLVRKV